MGRGERRQEAERGGRAAQGDGGAARGDRRAGCLGRYTGARRHCSPLPHLPREALGVVLHKDSKWYQQWRDFRDNNVVFNRECSRLGHSADSVAVTADAY